MNEAHEYIKEKFIYEFLCLFLKRLITANIIIFSFLSSSSFLLHSFFNEWKNKENKLALYIVTELKCMWKIMIWIYKVYIFFFILIFPSSFFFIDENKTKVDWIETSKNENKDWKRKIVNDNKIAVNET